MRIVQKVSDIKFDHKICLQVSGTKYPVISTRYRVTGTNSKKYVACNENSSESIIYYVCSQDLFTIIRNQVSSDKH